MCLRSREEWLQVVEAIKLIFRKLVEIIPALQTSQETLERAKAFGLACKKGKLMFS